MSNAESKAEQFLDDNCAECNLKSCEEDCIRNFGKYPFIKGYEVGIKDMLSELKQIIEQYESN